jgi:hypothetical protein
MGSGLSRWAVHAPSVHFWVLVGGAITLAAVAFVFSFIYFRRARVIEDTPTSRVRSAAQGFVELEGWCAVLDGAPIVAPLSGTVCAWFRYKAEEKQSNHFRGRGESRWSTLGSGTSDALFLLVDGPDRCVIDPEGAEVTVASKDVWYGASYPPGGGPRRRGLWGSMHGRYRYTEELLCVGEALYALGWFDSVRGGDDEFNTAAEVRDLIGVWKREQQNLLARFDANKDGVIDPREWEQVRAAAHQEVHRHQVERAGKPPIHTLGRPVDRSLPFMLSALPQHTLARRLQYRAAATLAAFLAAGVFAVWMVSVRLGA